MNNPFNRTAVFISLGLALFLVVGVLFGSKYFFNEYARQPIPMTPLPSPQADSAECAALIEALPENLAGLDRAEIAEPVPPGTAAWAETSDQPTTLRCGVDLPFQYTEYSTTEEIDGTRWLEVADMTPGSTLTTWYSTNRFPNVALTSWDDEFPTELSESTAMLAQEDQAPRPGPLSELKPAGEQGRCAALDANLRAGFELAEGYAYNGEFSKDHTHVWTAQSREPVVVRCGVQDAEGYEAGVQLQQIDGLPWFEDTTLAAGTTAGAWYAMGRDVNVAVHAPQDAAQEALVNISAAIEANTVEVAS